jgi:lysine 2,3-aminomutase
VSPALPQPSCSEAPSPAGELPAHRQFERGAFWRHVSAYREVSEETFLDPAWQARHTVTRVDRLRATLEGRVPERFFEDVAGGLRRSPMGLRVTPYVLSLVNWDEPYSDPIRRQFIPLGSQLLPDHPLLGLDSLAERADSAAPGLTHRYPDRALFLALNTCPVYCRFCTRSYAVGADTAEVSKVRFPPDPARWSEALRFIRDCQEIEDVVVSGGDVYHLRAAQLQELGDALLDIEHVRRVRFATKGPAVMPQKILRDRAWTDALCRLVDLGRARHREVAVHTHFNHPREATGITQDALDLLFERGVPVRNQCVLLRGVNDTPAVLELLCRKLSVLNVQPYYVFQHDQVRGVEDLRTALETARTLEKQIRGTTAGFRTPAFMVDVSGGGGKRDVHSFEHYDRETGISVFTSPGVKPGRSFFHFDPLDLLPEDGRRRWADPANHAEMLAQAMERARQGGL